MVNFGYRALFGTLALLSRRLTIVMFHRVPAVADALLPDENDALLFEQRCRWLARHFDVMTVATAAQHLAAGSLPPRALCITFDDGYADNAEVALPILQRLGLVATFFVTTRFLDGGMMWNDRIIEAVRAWPGGVIETGVTAQPHYQLPANRATAIDELLALLKYLAFDEREQTADRLLAESGSEVERLMMDADQIRALHDAGMEIGAHTHSHPIMSNLDRAALHEEIMLNKNTLEAITGSKVVTFAYPNGRADQDFNASHFELLEEAGFTSAVTTMPGTVGDLTHRFEIPRFSPWDRTETRYLARLALNYLREPTLAQAAAA